MSILLIATESVTEGAKGLFSSANLYNDILIIALVIVMITLLFSSIVVHRAMKAILRVTMPEKMRQEEEQRKAKLGGRSSAGLLWDKLLGLRPIEEEKDLMMDHEFDGIRELDNPIPLWFNALFYSTVVFGIAYLLIYQVFHWAPDQDQEYVIEMENAELAKQEFLAKSSNLVDESSVVFDAGLAPAGEVIYMANCVACHGGKGEGGIGPNLTDNFWLHGGDIKDIFYTVKYGVPEKGMVPWEQTLTPAQIAEVSSYIVTLVGTNPPNAKAAEGVEVVVGGESTDVASDSTANEDAIIE